MRRTAAALRLTLVALTGALAAACAHQLVDIAGDYLLARDAYDGIAHHSRGMLLSAVGGCALLFLTRVLFDALHRHSTSRTSLLTQLRAALGSPVRFAGETAIATIVLLAGMEYFDCALLGARIDALGDLFGGSIPLGLTAAIACGALAGTIAHRLSRLLSECEPLISGLVLALFSSHRDGTPDAPAIVRTQSAPIPRRVLLVTRGRKRGPPLLAPV